MKAFRLAGLFRRDAAADCMPEEALNFDARWPGPELMDDPACNETLLLRTVDQFRSINRLVGRYQTVLNRLVLDDMAREPDRDYHFIDLGAGGCDIPVWLLGAARRRGFKLRITALDSDERIVAHARKTCAAVEGLDIQHAELADLHRFGPVDYIYMNHVLHHLPDEIIPGVLRNMHRTARRRWIVSDLLRSRWSYLGFHVAGVFYHRSFAFEDGLRSIRRGFKPHELMAHARAAGIDGSVEVKVLTPGRLILTGFHG
jgi:2-polyprenyl-3-methyl-5-hydroxy-6-metoxy-1,4-benzoquinol methylase